MSDSMVSGEAAVTLRPARITDVGTIAHLIQQLAIYENLAAQMTGNPDHLRHHLFGDRPYAEAIVAEVSVETGASVEVEAEVEAEVETGVKVVVNVGIEADIEIGIETGIEIGIEPGMEVVGFALFFHNYSTFLMQPGLYLEDLFVLPAYRRRGVGTALLRHLAQLALERGCGRFEWSVLDWNQGAIDFYQTLGAEVLPDWRICRVAGSALLTLAKTGAES